MKDIIDSYLDTATKTIQSLDGLKDRIRQAAELMIGAIKSGGKIIIFGNGGSAADAQHIATELVSRFRKERDTIPAMALTTNTSMLTAISNDYSFDDVFSRQMEAFGVRGDVAIAISTSGNSGNIIKAAAAARERGLKVISLTGKSGGKLKEYSDILLNVASDLTSHVQEGHLAIYHLLCYLVEEESS
ncbi:MAG: D-sedoheptulose 7-phosphate isomerase [Elusimicrobia bacterium]|nr:D-sedoheptulose 7-phosphate isomerase [Elusimicrobiota bacterium]